MTYIRNILKAVLGKPIVKTLEVVEYVKEPFGLIKRDLATIKKYIRTKDYKLGDTLESVAYRQGQLDLVRMIETKLVAVKTRTLT